MYCPLSSKMVSSDAMMCFGVQVFLLIWVIFVPIVITSRLEKIIKLLEQRNKDS